MKNNTKQFPIGNGNPTSNPTSPFKGWWRVCNHPAAVVETNMKRGKVPVPLAMGLVMDSDPRNGFTEATDMAMNEQLIYLATPYSHPDPAVQQARFETVNRIAIKLMSEGCLVFSPISHSHPLSLAGDLPGDFAFWEAFDRRMIAACDKVVVVMLDGWSESRGVMAEVDIASGMGKPVEYLRPLPGDDVVAPTCLDRPMALVDQ